MIFFRFLKRILDLECEIYGLKNRNDTLNRKINERNGEISRLKRENIELNQKVEKLERDLLDKVQPAKTTITVRYKFSLLIAIFEYNISFSVDTKIIFLFPLFSLLFCDFINVR